MLYKTKKGDAVMVKLKDINQETKTLSPEDYKDVYNFIMWKKWSKANFPLKSTATTSASKYEPKPSMPRTA